MKLKMYQIDAFTDKVFAGNPAAVVPLVEPLDATLMQSIAAENNLAETAFYYPDGDIYQLRWFTPTDEVDFCGHATLATAWLLFKEFSVSQQELCFHTKVGELKVRLADQGLLLDFPALNIEAVDISNTLIAALGQEPEEVLTGMDIIAVFGQQGDIEKLQPDYKQLKQLPGRAVIITAPGREVDFVSRVFAPKVGVDEDPVTGSAHCALTPYWANRLDKPRLQAQQLSARCGELCCELKNDRIEILGNCAIYMRAEIIV